MGTYFRSGIKSELSACKQARAKQLHGYSKLVSNALNKTLLTESSWLAGTGEAISEEALGSEIFVDAPFIEEFGQEIFVDAEILKDMKPSARPTKKEKLLEAQKLAREWGES